LLVETLPIPPVQPVEPLSGFPGKPRRSIRVAHPAIPLPKFGFVLRNLAPIFQWLAMVMLFWPRR